MTRKVSDDANAMVVADRSVWLRVARLDHVSFDRIRFISERVVDLRDGS